MIKSIIEENKKITNESIMNDNASCLINSMIDSNGNFNIEYLRNKVPDQLLNVINQSIDKEKFRSLIQNCQFESEEFYIKNIINECYGINFLGKSLGRPLARQQSTTIFVPDKKNNEIINRNSKNIYITADNLEALRHLRNSYAGKIKCIYIDPPYNTGSDGFCYPDKFDEDIISIKKKFSLDDNTAQAILDMTSNKSTSHNAWLSFMYPRLLLAQELLSEDGVILVSIDENEYKSLGLLMDLVFEENNFVECLVYDKKAAPKGVPPKEMVVGVHEYIYAYAKNKEKFSFIGKKRDISDFKEDDNDGRGPWRNTNIKSTTGTDAYTIIDPKTGNEYTDTWAFEREELQKLIDDNRIIFPKDVNGQVRAKEYFNEFESQFIPLKSNLGLYDAQVNTLMLKKLMGKDKLFPNPKNLNLMRDLMSYVLNDGDVCLDFFGGSSSTAHGLIKYNIENNFHCNYILIQIPEPFKENSNAFKAGYKTIDELGIDRINRVNSEYMTEGKKVDGFKHYTLIDKGNTIDKLEKFKPEAFVIDEGIMSEFDADSLLITFACDDGYGLNPNIEKIDLGGYEVYRVENKDFTEDVTLYLLNADFEDKHNQALIKLSNERNLGISKIVIFGYAFNTRQLHIIDANRSQIGAKFGATVIKPIIKY